MSRLRTNLTVTIRPGLAGVLPATTAASNTCTFMSGVTQTAAHSRTMRSCIAGGSRTSAVALAETFVDSRVVVGVQAQEQGMHAADSVCTSGSADESRGDCTLLLSSGPQKLAFERVKTYKNRNQSSCISCSKDKHQVSFSLNCACLL